MPSKDSRSRAISTGSARRRQTGPAARGILDRNVRAGWRSPRGRADFGAVQGHPPLRHVPGRGGPLRRNPGRNRPQGQRRGRCSKPRASTRKTCIPQVVDLKALPGRKFSCAIVDDASGGWGHINFDNFRFHEQKPATPREIAPGSGPTFTPMPACRPKRPPRR